MKRIKELLQWMDDVAFYYGCGSHFPMWLRVELAKEHEIKKIARGWGSGMGYW